MQRFNEAGVPDKLIRDRADQLYNDVRSYLELLALDGVELGEVRAVGEFLAGHVHLAVSTVVTQRSAGRLRWSPDLALHAARKAAADAALAEYEFSEDEGSVSGTTSWQEDGDEWTCVLSMDTEGAGKYARGFIVRFKPATATVVEAYPGDPH